MSQTSLKISSAPAKKTRATARGAMLAAALVAPGEFQMVRRPKPQPGKGEVRVRIEGCGVCGSNLAPWLGRPWFSYPFEPGGPGHEGWGIVDALGPDVAGVAVGDRVAALSYHAFAEYDLASLDSLVRLPRRLAGQFFPGEALGCAMNVFARSKIRRGEVVAIVGVGFLGAVLTGVCARAGATVIGISRRPFALETALKMGAASTIRMDDQGRVVEQVKTFTSGRGCDCVIEATGLQGPLDIAGELTRERGRLVIAGYHQDGPRQVNLRMWNWRGIDVINAHERDLRICAAGIQAAADAVATGAIDPAPLYTHTFCLGEIGEAFNAMKQRPGDFLKALVII